MTESIEDGIARIKRDSPIGDVTTWADGFGNWHAAIHVRRPDMADAPTIEKIARTAIRRELDARQDRAPGYRVRVAPVDRVTGHPDASGGMTGERWEYVEK